MAARTRSAVLRRSILAAAFSGQLVPQDDLAVRAGHYKRILLPEEEEHPGVRRGLQFLSRWRATTAHPRVMYLYELREEGRLDVGEMAEILLNLESFLIRRLLVGVSTKNLNRISCRSSASCAKWIHR